MGLLDAIIEHGERVVREGSKPVPVYYLDLASVDQHKTDQVSCALDDANVPIDSCAKIQGGVPVLSYGCRAMFEIKESAQPHSSRRARSFTLFLCLSACGALQALTCAHSICSLK
jgi:hypothetical protein